MEKSELLQEICEKIQELDSQKQKDKKLREKYRKLKKLYEFLRRYKTDPHLIKQFQKEFFSEDNVSTKCWQEPVMEKRPNNGRKEKKSMGEWLHGCQLCNEGVIVEMKKIIETGVSVNKASKILAEMAAKQIGEELFTAEAIRNRYRFHVGQREPNPKVGHNDQPKIQKPEKASDSGILPVNQVQLELPLEVGPKCLEPQEKSVCPQMEELGVDYIVNRQKAAARAQQRQESELGRADRAIRRAARLMEMIVEGQIENNGSDIDQLSAASIKRHGPGIIISFIQLGIDVFKVHEFYMGRKGGVSETAIELSDFTMQETCKQRVPDLPPYVQ